ncbi:MAG TPA: L,D-transpeptidase [Marmoricola sp.]|jgi:hypothetical protein|nr:L,D-transpeptidase [Marmoricola sp.]
MRARGVGRRRAPRRRAGRPRYDRVGAAAFSLAVTAIALLAGIGVIPVGSGTAGQDDLRVSTAAVHEDGDALSGPSSDGSSAEIPTATDAATEPDETLLPADSGEGRRVVFSIGHQRVWLVDRRDRVLSTYLVSGSVTDNLEPGSYAVYSRSRWAVGIGDSGVMQYFVRFTRGQNAAIGFHSIPTKHGEPLQTEAQLGTPTSHGCIRQRLADAERLWRFAPDGTAVVVTA